ncbi:MAG TPA: hypothetical protein RMH85_29485 [Polyangiaceae bacterium LLY-WYZ-15_(1-7)]|nr:hypothetical protein [Myxococcales bacterium]MBJ74160.1 hypothetical protein [Sandaracinus sp.]HJL02668.1 hypothetical protein [Polyangiaceae bacterium LLY-WYZ-15_(1-7)]HJL12650.1 hypothetical protein [Polyangiaceae bacterium LLY-WYZ-15_(1-7)]HJL30309.1 hypothetical protein [Polyangiaceae bacterium LLY-WYZ-15_(1-7)]
MNRALPLLLLALLACGDDDAPADAGADGGADGGVDGGSNGGVDAGPPYPPWPAALPPATTLGERRGRRLARATVHLHSPLSHDACDGEGWVDGALADAACLAHLRDAMCALHLDAAMLTDHAPHVEEVGLEGALWIAEGDEPLRDAEGAVVASRLACPDGHRVLVQAGSENALMPLGLDRHPTPPGTPAGEAPDPDALRALYDARTPEAIAALREAGALIWQAHTEEHALDVLRASDLDGLEIYNLHANVDPGIREEFLGLEPVGFLPELLAFTRASYRLPPDLAVLAFLDENRPALEKWDTLLAEGLRPTGTGGCDAHENAFPQLLGDGERADSYRRMMFWISNHLLVDEVSPAGVEEALAAGRLYVTFEVFGSPVGFDFVGRAGEALFEMGEDAPAGATLELTRPRLPEGWPSDPPPELSLHILRAAEGGAVEVARGEGETLRFVADAPGAYRAEVRMVPEHARAFLGRRADGLVREVVWVYSNPIFVAE